MRRSGRRDRRAVSGPEANPVGTLPRSWPPLPGEPIIDKPGKGGFYATDLDQILRRRGIRNLVITGITSDCCVHSTMRQATDHGYECVLLEDCSASTEEVNHDGIVRITKAGYGQFGVVSDSETLLKGLP